MPVFKRPGFLPGILGPGGRGIGIQIEVGGFFDTAGCHRCHPARAGLSAVALAVLAWRPQVHHSLALAGRARGSNLFREPGTSGYELAGGSGEIVNEREHAKGESRKEEFQPCVCDGAQLAVAELPAEVGRRCQEVRHIFAALHREREFVGVERSVKIWS